jgi:hypothetical protein
MRLSVGAAAPVFTYTSIGGTTKVDLEGTFPLFPGMPEAEELQMIDGFFLGAFGEDVVTLRTWN